MQHWIGSVYKMKEGRSFLGEAKFIIYEAIVTRVYCYNGWPPNESLDCRICRQMKGDVNMVIWKVL